MDSLKRASTAANSRPVGVLGLAVLVLLAAVVSVALLQHGAADSMPANRGGGEASPGDRIEVRRVELPAPRPAAGADGTDGRLEDMAVTGDAVVAVGSLRSGDRREPIFVRSTDQGLTWQDGTVVDLDRQAAGDDRAWSVAAGPGGLAAVGWGAGRVVTWTSKDGLTWTRHVMDRAVFGPQDSVRIIRSGPQGLIALGSTVVDGDSSTGALWDSTDGENWRRRSASELGLTVSAGWGAMSFSSLAWREDTVVLVGSEHAEGVDHGTRRVGVWTSTDRGATFTGQASAQGLGGTNWMNYLSDIVSGPDGFVAVGSGGDARYGDYDAIALRSRDGITWTREPDGPLAREGEDFPYAVASGAAGEVAVGRTDTDGFVARSSERSWNRDASAEAALMGPGTQVATSVAIIGDVVLAVGVDTRTDDEDPLVLRAAGSGPVVRVDLPSIRQRSVPSGTPYAMTTTPQGLVVVGSAAGDGVVWRSADGTSFQVDPDLRASGAHTQQLSDVVVSPDGTRLAVAGSTGLDVSYAALALRAHAGGLTRFENSAVLKGDNDFEGRHLSAVVQHGDLTVWVGSRDDGSSEGGAFVVFTRGDRLEEGRSAGPRIGSSARSGSEVEVLPDDLEGGTGLDRTMNDVAAGPWGLVAVGSASTAAGAESGPAAWTSADAATWALHPLPVPAGLASVQLTDVIGTPEGWISMGTGRRDGHVVALCWTSTDGTTWTAPMPLPGTDGADAAVSDVVLTPRGMVATGSATQDGDRDARLWTSTDGATWRALDLDEPARGRGLQALHAATVHGDHLVAIGSSLTMEGSQALVVSAPLSMTSG